MNALLLQLSNCGYTAVTPHVETPSLWTLSKAGCALMSYIAQPVGMLSNVAMLTGRFSERHFGGEVKVPGSYWDGDPEKTLPASSLPTLSNVLADAGFATGLFGKHGLGAPFQGPRQEVYQLHGYQVWRAGIGQNVTDGGGTDYDDWMRTDDGTPEALSAEWAGGEVVDEFLGWWQATPSPKFARLSFSEAHGPFRGLPPVGLLPDGWSPPQFLPPVRQRYEGYVALLDEAVRRVMDAVHGDTLVFLASDCGTPDRADLVSHLAPPCDDPARHKRSCYRHGIHVPAAVVGPTIQPGTYTDELVSCADVGPTILEVLGVPKPAEWIDGTSALAALQGRACRDFAYAAIGTQKSVESASLKLHRLADGTEVVYDKETDEDELAPVLASQHPNQQAVTELQQRMADPRV